MTMMSLSHLLKNSRGNTLIKNLTNGLRINMMELNLTIPRLKRRSSSLIWTKTIKSIRPRLQKVLHKSWNSRPMTRIHPPYSLFLIKKSLEISHFRNSKMSYMRNCSFLQVSLWQFSIWNSPSGWRSSLLVHIIRIRLPIWVPRNLIKSCKRYLVHLM